MCFNRKSRKCAFCNAKVENYVRYELTDDDPNGLVGKSAMLGIMLKKAKIAKRNRIVCPDCCSLIEKLCVFKNRLSYVNHILTPEGLMISNMCSVCYDYNPNRMSCIFNELISHNHSLISGTFELNFANIVRNMKLTCDDCISHLSLFCNLHVNFERAHPGMNSKVVDVNRFPTRVDRRWSSLLTWCSTSTPDEEPTERQNNEEQGQCSSSDSRSRLRRIPSVPKNLDSLETLYQSPSFEEDSDTEPFFYDYLEQNRTSSPNRLERFSELSTTDNCLDLHQAVLDSPAGPSDATYDQQEASTSKASGNQLKAGSKLKRWLSKKSRSSSSDQTVDENEKSSTKAKKRKGKRAKKIAVLSE